MAKRVESYKCGSPGILATFLPGTFLPGFNMCTRSATS
jgi:hypothetical protein